MTMEGRASRPSSRDARRSIVFCFFGGYCFGLKSRDAEFMQ
jgi:hypothetical protein